MIIRLTLRKLVSQTKKFTGPSNKLFCLPFDLKSFVNVALYVFSIILFMYFF